MLVIVHLSQTTLSSIADKCITILVAVLCLPFLSFPCVCFVSFFLILWDLRSSAALQESPMTYVGIAIYLTAQTDQALPLLRVLFIVSEGMVFVEPD